MAFRVRFYKQFQKRSDSTLKPNDASAFYDDYQCTLKDGTNITSPEIELTLASGDPVSKKYSYAYIPQFNRYYFINNWTYYRNTWTGSLSVDVLASYKDDIAALDKYVLRSASYYDNTIIDNMMTKQPPIVIHAGNKQNGELYSPFTATSAAGGSKAGFYIIGIQGPSPDASVPTIGGISYYRLNYTQMSELLDYLTSEQFAALQADDAAGLTAEVVKTLQDPAQYIVSCMWFPINVSTTGNIQPQIGMWSTSPLQTPCAGIGSEGWNSLTYHTTFNNIQVLKHPKSDESSYGVWLNNPPYSVYKFHFEPWGDLDVQQGLLMDIERISGTITIDLITGMAVLTLYGHKDTLPSKSIELGRHYAQVGVTVGISQLMYDLTQLSGGGAVVTMGASVIKDISTLWQENSQETGGGFFKTARAFIKDIFTSKEEAAPEQLTGGTIIQNAVTGGLAYSAVPQRNGVNGSYLSYVTSIIRDQYNQQYSIVGPYVEATFFDPVDPNNDEEGRPLMRKVNIGTLRGFVKCADGDHNIAAISSEKRAISSYLTGGFFYE